MQSILGRTRAIALIAVPALALGLAGCSTGGASADPNTLTIASGQKSAVAPLIAAFEKANPGVTVKPTYVEDDAAYTEQLRTQLSAGTAPDVFKTWPGGGSTGGTWALAKDGLLASLDDEPWASDVPDALRNVSSWDGTLYSLPANGGGIGAIYNDQAVAAAGATIPTTWSEVLDFCATAKAAGKVAYVLGNKDSWTAQMIPYALTATLVYGPDPTFGDEQAAGTATFSDSKWKDALEKVDELKSAGCFNEGPNGTGFDQQMHMLGFGDALATVQVSQALPVDENVAPNTTFTLAPFPATDNAADTYVPVAAGVSFAINAKAKNAKLAKKFIDYVASPEGQTLFAKLSNSTSTLPADPGEPNAVLDPIIKAQADGHGTSYPDQAWPNTKVQEEYLISLQEFYNGDLTIPDFLKRLDDAYAAG
ncbi:ABC transporter substrate-binding protein [Galbitalea sp. SE-J8]|uniref:ABC transporter substrate-binding protein n=1 Tax=Galbitalea sp. SE-J8 TaxID=3054952 RepID=UPI00259CD6C8|nr:ABC transporter substrate-binding protein [Galbitalea sp. SE-J8]MDM4762052.1 ABC transporter substrate-binding protein [Galbitalea sp. SE-J8]